MFYDLIKMCASVCFNVLNILLGGKLPPFGSAAVVVEEQDKYLVVELPRGRIAFPGGFMNWQETPMQAAKREGREETGLHIDIGAMVGCYSLSTIRLTSMSTVSFVFEGKVIGGQLRNNVEGRPCWMYIDELRPKLTGHSQRVLDDYLYHRDLRGAKGTLPVII